MELVELVEIGERHVNQVMGFVGSLQSCSPVLLVGVLEAPTGDHVAGTQLELGSPTISILLEKGVEDGWVAEAGWGARLGRLKRAGGSWDARLGLLGR